MFNVRPNPLSPWLYVEPPQPDDPPGFRVAPDGSVIDAKRAPPFAPFGSDPHAGTEPSAGTDFEAAICLVPGGRYDPADLATLPRSPVQEALDQIARIYAGFGTKPSSLLDRQGQSTATVAPVGGRPFSPYAVGSSLSQPAEPPINPVGHVEGDYLPIAERPFGSPSDDLRQIDPQLAPRRAPESLRAPDQSGKSLAAGAGHLPPELNSEPLIGRRSLDAQPISSPSSRMGAANPSAVFDDGTGMGTMPANDDQIAQAPPPQQRTQKPSPNPRQQKPEPLASEQQLQVKATQRLNTQLARADIWGNVIRQPLPENLSPGCKSLCPMTGKGPSPK